MKFFDFLKGEKLAPKLDSKFRSTLIAENSKRLFCLLVSIAILESLILLSELAGLVKFSIQIYILQLLIIFLSLLSSAALYFFKKYLKLNALSVFITVMHAACLIMSFVFSASMQTASHISYSAFFIGTLIVLIVFIRKPYLSIPFFALTLISLSLYVLFTYPVSTQMITEIINAGMFITLISIGSILVYNRHKKLFLQEERIKDINEKLRLLSITDELTGLYNRRRLYEEFDREIVSSERYKKSLSIILIDIDNFKSINDRYGHNIGDLVLKQFADILKSKLRSTDIIGRWGGEEFIVVCTNTSIPAVTILAKRLCKTIEEYDFDHIDNITFSAGVSQFRLGEKPTDMIDRADKALYSAKTSGRNCVKEIT